MSTPNSQVIPARKMPIRLKRQDGNTSWGFRLQGGTDFQTPLSIQSVNPGSVAEQCGLRAGDAILSINQYTSDMLTHGEAKEEIMRSGNDIAMLIERGAVKIWKPQVTPMSELRPAQLNTIQTATGETIVPVQKTSLTFNRPPDEPSLRIGSSHNRSAKPFGQPTQKTAVPNVVHAQYNSPMGLYSANNIADTYSQQTAGIQDQMAGLDISKLPAGSKMSNTMQSINPEDMGKAPFASSYTPPQAAPEGFRSISAPVAQPPSEKPKQPTMRCPECDLLATGVIVKANGTTYHMTCFKCASCSMNLKQKGYFVVNGKLYCETHAKRLAEPPAPNMVATAVYR